MISVCSQVIAPPAPPSSVLLASPRLPLLNERIKEVRMRQWALAEGGEGPVRQYRQSIITCNETFVLEHYSDVLEVTLEVVFRWRKSWARLKSSLDPSHPYVQ